MRLKQTDDERWWLAFRAIARFSLNTKYLIAFYLVALAIALLTTPKRDSLLRPWDYLGALLAGVMVLPNVMWQQAHGWPFIELGKARASGKNIVMSPPVFSCNKSSLPVPWRRSYGYADYGPASFV